jgi:hypothetical protein
LFTTDGDDDDQRGVLFVSHYASWYDDWQVYIIDLPPKYIQTRS